MAKMDFTLVPHEKPYQYEEGDLKVTRMSAWSGPGCHGVCGVLCYTDDNGKLVKVEGDSENPFNQGRLCMRCLDLPEVTNHKDRLLYPMKRDRKDRGLDKWERITWDEAFDLVEKNLKEIAEKYGPESIVFCQGTGRDIAAWITRLAWSYGSPNYGGFFSGQACYVPRIAAMVATTGSYWVTDYSQQFPDRYDNPNYHIPETLFIWGCYPLNSNPDCYYGHWVTDVMKRGTKIVMIDPKVTWLSARSEIHLPVRPGTDAALALGMLNVIINEDLYDHDFVDKWCYGFDELAQRVAEYPVDKVSEITWVPSEKIIAAARLLATSKPAALHWGVAFDQTKEAIPAAVAAMNLFEITGNIDVPGGMMAPVSILDYASGWGQELISPEQKAKRIGLDKYKLLQFGFQTNSAEETVAALKTDKPYKIHGCWIQTNNLLACMAADPRLLQKLIGQLDFVVDVDLFKTPTNMALADVLLPAATYPERDGICIGAGTQRAESIVKVTQIGECKSDMEINLEIGKRLNPEAWPWDNVDDMFTHILEKELGISFDWLKENTPAYPEFEYKKYEKGKMRPDGGVGFGTATGRIELYSTFLESAGLDPLPYFEEPNPGPGSTPALMSTYPLILTTGARNINSFHSEHRQIERLRKYHPDPTVSMNPETGEKYGVEEGDWVWIENDKGRAKSRVKFTPCLDPRIISADHAWWFPEADPENLYDALEVNINNLVPYECGKSGFGSNYKTTLCRIYKCESGR